MEIGGSTAANNSSKSPPTSRSNRDSSCSSSIINSPVHHTPVHSDNQHQMTMRSSPLKSHNDHVTNNVNYDDNWTATITQTDSGQHDEFSHTRRTVPELMASGFTPPPASAAADSNPARTYSSSSGEWESAASYTQLMEENAALKNRLREETDDLKNRLKKETDDKIYLQRQVNGLNVLPGLLQKKADECKRWKRRALLSDDELAQLTSILTQDQLDSLQRRGVQLRCLGQGNTNSGSLDESVMTSSSSLACLTVSGNTSHDRRSTGEASGGQQSVVDCDQETINVLKMQTVMYKEDFDAEKQKADKLERQLAVVMTERSLATDRLRQCEADVMNLREENTLLRTRLQQVMQDASLRSSESRQASQLFAATRGVATDLIQQQQRPQQQQQHRSNSALPTTTHSAAAAADVPAAWPCSSCTYVNRGTAAYCDMCCTLKPSCPRESSFGFVGSRLQVDDPFN